MSQAKFDKAVAIVQSLPADGPVKPTNDQKLVFYGLYKQATIGDNETSKPGMFDLTGKYKWQAWTDVKGLSKEDAKAQYVEKLLEVLRAADNEDAKKYIAEIEAA
ncbi:hypothetical protein HGRIS_004506 [Hohenbuehelia grisea]|uniref:ACB domain-containing protein n=1 Tax=Hohenbuehelia grisea TaxID=104357 RepID=A0ABR3JC31_9AGAR